MKLSSTYRTLHGPTGPIATDVAWATTFWTRYRGLRGRPQLSDDQALVLRPCRQVHTFGLRYEIDVVFCDDELIVVHVTQLAPRRVSRSVRNATLCIELASGRAAACGITQGVQLAFEAERP